MRATAASISYLFQAPQASMTGNAWYPSLRSEQRREGAAGADRDPGDDDVTAPGLLDYGVGRGAEGRVFVCVDDPGAPDDGGVGEELFELGDRVTVLPLGIRRGDQCGQLQRLRRPRQPEHVAPEFDDGAGVAGADHQADLVVDEQDDAVVHRGLVVAEPALGASICRCGLVREWPVGGGADDVGGAISHFGAPFPVEPHERHRVWAG